MDVNVPADKYVVAVSGGVDSMVLLSLLARRPELEIIVAHFNHGIRADAVLDEKLVAATAKKYNLPVKIGRADLGSKISEEKARMARYRFLEAVKNRYKANAIITAHHQDDLIETALINIVRGTGHRGMVAIAKNPNIMRPMLNIPKSKLIDYANQNHIVWREDSTNKNIAYLRNYIRQSLMTGLSEQQRQYITDNIEKIAHITDGLNKLVAKLSEKVVQDGVINRQAFISLPREIENELVHYWLRQQKVEDIDRETVERIGLALKTAQPNTIYPVKKGLILKIQKQTAHFGNTLK
jgi:tRNA(Ile)-lysidine synthase